MQPAYREARPNGTKPSGTLFVPRSIPEREHLTHASLSCPSTESQRMPTVYGIRSAKASAARRKRLQARRKRLQLYTR